MLTLQVEQNFEPPHLQAAYAKLLDPQTLSGHIFADCLERYLSKLNIPKSLAPKLRLLTWLIHCSLEPEAKIIYSTFFALWQEEIARL